jgi:probable phosphoglycerate mutase
MSADSHDAQLTRVIAVRHGETVWNAELRMQGQLDTPLSARGRWQAARVAVALVGERIDVVIASDLTRALDTGRAIADRAGAPIEIDAGLRERSFGVFEGYTYAEIDQHWPVEAARWRRHEPDFGPDGGETFADFYLRSISAATRIAARHAGRSIVIATHGGVLDCLYRAASNIALDAPRTWQLGNAAINRLLYTPRGFTLVGWSDTSHLEGEMPLDDRSDEGGAPVPTPMARLA